MVAVFQTCLSFSSVGKKVNGVQARDETVTGLMINQTQKKFLMVTSTITAYLICCLWHFSIKLGEMVSVCVLALLKNILKIQ